MGQSTDGQICYGVMLGSEEDIALPWDGYDDVDDWWLYEVLKFKHSFELFDDNGEWINGVEPPQKLIDEYFAERRVFVESNPKPPVVLVNGCSSSYPVWIAAVPASCQRANRGYPKKFDPDKLVINDKDRLALIEFCDEYELEYDDDPFCMMMTHSGGCRRIGKFNTIYEIREIEE